MLRRPLALCALLAVLAASGCDGVGSEPTFDISAYLGTYTGTRTIIEDDRASLIEGVTFEIAADEAARTVTLTLTPDIGAPEVLRGAYDDGGIDIASSYGGLAVSFSVVPDGTVSGTWEVTDQGAAVSGTLTPARFDLTFTPADPGGTRTEIRTSR